jgi:hypothetical protein
MPFLRSVQNRVERTVYVIAGLPIAFRGGNFGSSGDSREIRRVFARHYWRPRSTAELLELAAGLLLAPIAVPLAALWFTARNGRIIRTREGRSIAGQFIEQLRLYASAGVFGPWYYIFSLHRDGARRAPTFLQRCETKRGLYALLKGPGASPLGHKQKFAERCATAGARCVCCELVIGQGAVDPASLPDVDLFVKPLIGCGGKGAERWDRVGHRRWSDGSCELEGQQLIDRLRTRGRPLVVQKRVLAHPSLLPLTSGALPTVRLLTCLDEQNRPEAVAAVFRMSVGANRTVDNFHAGGVACAVSLGEGELGIASDLGADARLGWCVDHPTTGARISGTLLPYWDQVKSLGLRAHDAFNDRVLIGWDIAISDDGPIIIEGNRGPDLDIMQRFMDVGFYHEHRLSQLIAHHLRARGELGIPAGRRQATQWSEWIPSERRARRARQ